MKNKIILYSLLGLTTLFLSMSCEKDDTTPPKITISSPTSSTESLGNLHITFDLTENDELHTYEIKIIDPSDGTELYFESQHEHGKELAVDKLITLDFPRTDNYELTISASDHHNNVSTETIIFKGRLAAKLAMNFKLQYDGEPMVMFDNYTYPELDFSFFLTRVSMYISNVQPTGSNFSNLENIGLIRLEETHLNETDASLGYTYTLPMPEGDFESINF